VLVKLALLCVGKLREDAERAIVGRYLERFGQIGPGLGLACGGVTEILESRAPSADARKVAEAAEIRKRIPASARITLLDEKGRSMVSDEFAALLRRWQEEGARNAVFVIGGPDGLDPELRKEADLCLALGRLTMPHGLARAVLAEQLYRAATLLARHPYHRA
jgi:23S rRNA (pseudouridine1915-N3)-methyltransferase